MSTCARKGCTNKKIISIIQTQSLFKQISFWAQCETCKKKSGSGPSWMNTLQLHRNGLCKLMLFFSVCSSETLVKEACVTKLSCWSQMEQWRIMKPCLKNTTGQIGRFVWKGINRKGKERSYAATVGIEECEPGWQAEWRIHILQYPRASCC